MYGAAAVKAPAAATRLILESARRAWARVAPPARPRVPDLEGQAASDLIREAVAGDAPAMVARFGAVELDCLLNYEAISSESSRLRKALSFVCGKAQAFWWRDSTIRQMRLNAGFFPSDPALLARFAERMLEDIEAVDILGSWLPGEEHFADRLGRATTVRLRDVEPYYHDPPWTEALEDRTVLVVHPFAATIRSQYERRESLFRDPRLLPTFELKTLEAVQSSAGAATRFGNWFEALDFMADAVAETEFDVALLGCGAYGFPLAAHVKRLGRTAVHLGGPAQILFGIKGRRWDEHEFIGRLYNDSWVRPSDAERPASYLDVEEGCYW